MLSSLPLFFLYKQKLS